MKSLFLATLIMITSPLAAQAEDVQSQDNVLHLYSSRHYDSDKDIYAKFTKMTGIEIKLVEGKDDALITRLNEEGDASPADILITADAGRLWRAEDAGLFQATNNEKLKAAIPENYRDPEGHWFGFTKRARVIFYDKDAITEGEITSYSDLIKPDYKGQICIRTSSNIYNLSLLGSFIALNGNDAAKEWASGILANLARKPQGGDTDQIRAVHAGACNIAIGNSYYYARLMRSDKEEDRKISEKVGILFPDQNDKGTHVNVSGAGILKSSDNVDAAEKFLEYLASAEAQKAFSDGNNEYPIVKGIEPNDTLKSFGDFKSQDVNVRAFGENQRAAQMLFDEIGFF